MRPPLLQKPTYLGLAPVSDMPPVAQKVASVAKQGGGLILGATVGATVAYFVPKIIDHYLNGSNNRAIEDDTGEAIDLEVGE
jgi:hypothetical protein